MSKLLYPQYTRKAAFAGDSLFTRFPANTLMKGGNVPFRPADDSSFTFFGGLWGGGGQTWNQAWFTNEIDRASSIGLNIIRLFGDLELQIGTGPFGSLDHNTFLTRVGTIIDYARQQNIYVIMTGASVYELYGVANTSGVITSTALGYLSDLYSLCNGKTNVIAFDPIQESYAWVNNPQGNPNGYLHQANITAAQLATMQSTIYSTLRPTSNIPITFSGPSVGFPMDKSMWLTNTNVTALESIVDYWDHHVYYGNSTAPGLRLSHVDQMKSHTTKKWLCGEFGTPVTPNPGLGSGADYNQMKTIHEHSPSRGSLCWALGDQSTNSNDSWGCFDNSGNVRSIATTLGTYATAAGSSGDLQTITDGHGIVWHRFSDASISYNHLDANDGQTNQDIFLVTGDAHVIGTDSVEYKWDYTNHQWVPA